MVVHGCFPWFDTCTAEADPGFPVGGAPTLVGGGANLQHRHFSVKTYVKTKEFGPVGGRAPETFVCRSATVQSRRKYPTSDLILTMQLQSVDLIIT